jgi:acetyl esterase
VPPLYEQNLDMARRAMSAAARNADREPIHRCWDETLAGPRSGVPVRFYRPDGEGLLPVLVYLHGGSWVVGDLDSHDADCRSLANLVGCLVVAVHYRLAPEDRFPAPVEDTYAVLAWLNRSASEVGGDPERVAIGGVSAGGNLAAAATLMARDRGGPSIVHQLLVYPITDVGLDTPSYERFADGHVLTRASMRWAWAQYLRRPEDGFHPYASPLRAPSLDGLPPALVITAECDPLCDEGEAYGRRLQAAGVHAVVSRFSGMVHTFFSTFPPLDATRRARSEAAAALRCAFRLQGDDIRQ